MQFAKIIMSMQETTPHPLLKMYHCPAENSLFQGVHISVAAQWSGLSQGRGTPSIELSLISLWKKSIVIGLCRGFFSAKYSIIAE